MLTAAINATIFNPLQDARWDAFVAAHPRASVFHSRAWLTALQQTYGFQPLLLADADDAAIRQAVVFCQVRSALTGNRMVSLPFSDHCEPLVDSTDALGELLAAVPAELQAQKAQYAELRPLTLAPAAGWSPAQKFYLHRLALDAAPEVLLARTHKDCVQRKVRRAEREGLVYRSGRSPEMLRDFFRLLIRTRRRHCVLPQPMAWFRNLAAALGDAFTVRTASWQGRAIAAIVTLAFKDTLVYKHGASDERHHALGAMPWLFCKAIGEAHSAGLHSFDFGRSDQDAGGLIRFKEHLGARRSELLYWRMTAAGESSVSRTSRWMSIPGRSFIFRAAPDGLLAVAGKILYSHWG